MTQDPRNGRRRASRLIAALALAAGLSFAAHPAHATGYAPSVTITVNSRLDNNTGTCAVPAGVGTGCTLRAAINQANADFGANIIILIRFSITAPCSTPIALLLGTLTVNSPGNIVQIIGPIGPTYMCVDGSGNTPPASDFSIESPTQMNNFTITGGSGTSGGGIYVNNGFTLRNAVITKNNAGITGQGGGIFVDCCHVTGFYPAVTMNTVQISSNAAQYGGGIFNYGTTQFSGAISHNIACAAFSGTGSATPMPWTPGNICISNSTAQRGGGIWNDGQITMTGTLSNNSAGNPAYSGVSAGGTGGGLYNEWSAHLSNATVSGNTAGLAGGGITNTDAVQLASSTVTTNVAGYYGGGEYEDGQHTTGTVSTFSGNSAGGLFYCTQSTATFTPVTCTSATPNSHGVVADCASITVSTKIQCNAQTGYGGAILNDSAVQLNGGYITSNRAITNSGTATATTPTTCSSFPNASGSGGSEGGAVYVEDPLTLTHVNVNTNTAACGGALFVTSYYGSSVINGSPLSYNQALVDGGAVYVQGVGHLVLFTSSVTNNSALLQTGGIYNDTYGGFVLDGTNILVPNTGGTCPDTFQPCT